MGKNEVQIAECGQNAMQMQAEASRDCSSGRWSRYRGASSSYQHRRRGLHTSLWLTWLLELGHVRPVRHSSQVGRRVSSDDVIECGLRAEQRRVMAGSSACDQQ